MGDGLVESKEFRGKGCDRNGTKKDGLKLNWHWGRICDRSWPPGASELEDTRRTPGQTCYANAGKFKYEVVLWHDNYEARVDFKGEEINSWKKGAGDYYPGDILLTRLQAQLKAEKLLVEFQGVISEHLKKCGLTERR